MISSHVHSTRLCHLSVENEDVRYHNASFESSGKNNSLGKPQGSKGQPCEWDILAARNMSKRIAD